ncbi:MAG: class I SAM-dependent methyltransferase [Gammaproteobacteria bacterium]|nr:class I SAM-dependent methyltransferase [Gammaproteobacteria bacterium]
MTTATAITAGITPDYTAIKTKQRNTWGSGDYGRVGVTLQITGESLCEAMDIRSGQSVLDVAAGNGNASLAAARRFCKVVSTDYVPSLLDRSRVRAAAEHLAIEYQEADAEDLPFADASFDNVVSTFGVMFAPNQGKAASELVRVCREGGKIGLANWTPESFIGQLFKTVGRHVSPAPGVNSPASWGTEAFLNEHFGPKVSKIDVNKRQFNFRYHSPKHWLDIFGTYYGPTLKAFEALSEQTRPALRKDLEQLIGRFNRADDGTMVVPSDYLEVVITR